MNIVIGTSNTMRVLARRNICHALSSESHCMNPGKKKKSGAKDSIPRAVQIAVKSICGNTRRRHADEKNIFQVVSIRSRTLRDSKNFIDIFYF